AHPRCRHRRCYRHCCRLRTRGRSSHRSRRSSPPRCPPRRTRGTERACRPSAHRHRRGSRSPLPRKSRLRPTRGLLPRPSPALLGTGVGGLLLQSWARPPRKRPRSRTPLHPSAEEPAPHRLLSGPTRGVGSRLSGIESMEEAEREEEEEGEEEEEEESPKELEPEEEEITMATGVGGFWFSALLALGGRRSLL